MTTYYWYCGWSQGYRTMTLTITDWAPLDIIMCFPLVTRTMLHAFEMMVRSNCESLNAAPYEMSNFIPFSTATWICGRFSWNNMR